MKKLSTAETGGDEEDVYCWNWHWWSCLLLIKVLRQKLYIADTGVDEEAVYSW